MPKPIVVAAVALALALAACAAYEPYRYVDKESSMTGPGMFTGEKGEWVIFRK